jgi:hypothetical protein
VFLAENAPISTPLLYRCGGDLMTPVCTPLENDNAQKWHGQNHAVFPIQPTAIKKVRDL